MSPNYGTSQPTQIETDPWACPRCGGWHHGRYGHGMLRETIMQLEEKKRSHKAFGRYGGKRRQRR